MIRLNEPWCVEPGTPSALAEQESVESEQDWHNVFQERMREAGWTLKHEIVCNEDKRRADFVAYHDELNPSYDEGEWVGFELKYSDHGYTRARSAATQIDAKYREKTWLSSGEKIDFWVVAPYVAASHSPPRWGASDHHFDGAHQMTMSRAQEAEAARLLNRLGYGYLFSWHPSPFISIDEPRANEVVYPRYEEFVNLPGIPAFEGRLDSFQVRSMEDMVPLAAAKCRVKSDGDGLTYDRMAMAEERDDVMDLVRGGSNV